MEVILAAVFSEVLNLLGVTSVSVSSWSTVKGEVGGRTESPLFSSLGGNWRWASIGGEPGGPLSSLVSSMGVDLLL